jgi:hypothetical protein
MTETPPHAYTPHPDRHGCSLCPYSPHHSVHTDGDMQAAARPPEDKLFYGKPDAPHIGRRGSDPGRSFPQRLRGDEAA